MIISGARCQFWLHPRHIPTKTKDIRNLKLPKVFKKENWVWNFALQKKFLSKRCDIRNKKTFGLSEDWCADFIASAPYINQDLHPPKPTWIPKIPIFKRRYIFQTIILGIHVSFQGCMSFAHMSSVKIHGPTGRTGPLCLPCRRHWWWQLATVDAQNFWQGQSEISS